MKESDRRLPLRAFQWDLARQVERLDWLTGQLPRYADWGYQELYLHLEDAVRYPSLPGVGRRDAYTHRQLGTLVDAAARSGIKVVPIVNLLGHTQYLLNVPSLRDLNERRAADGSPLGQGQICPLHPRTLAVAEKLLRDMAPFCTAGKVHVGLDESYHLGRHPRSRAEIARIGLAAHFAGHVRRLHAITERIGLRLGLWADMLALLPGAIPLLPRGVIAYDWYYYPFRGRPRIEAYNFAPCDLTPALRARGIEYWGCPMSGAFRHEPLPLFHERLANVADWWRRSRRTGAAGMLVTSWEPSRMAAETAMTVDAAAAGLWLDGEEDPGRLLESGCRRMYGRKGPRAAGVLARADRYPFLGYPRWRINDRWDGGCTGQPLAPWRKERALCRRLAAAGGLPPAVGASLRFRAYLAERDVFVRDAGLGVWRMRAALARGERARARGIAGALDRAAVAFGRRLREGRAAARQMWRRTRDPRATGPNEKIIAGDAGRLGAWRAWLKDGEKMAWRGSPVAGAWQLLFTVENFAPALQKVVVERRVPGGGWKAIDGMFTIEFQAGAARRRARRLHRMSIPLESPILQVGAPSVRIVVRGFGQVRVRDAVATNGVDRFAAKRARGGSVVIGRRAPKSGYPDFDWEKNRGAAWVPEFERTIQIRRVYLGHPTSPVLSVRGRSGSLPLPGRASA